MDTQIFHSNGFEQDLKSADLILEEVCKFFSITKEQLVSYDSFLDEKSITIFLMRLYTNISDEMLSRQLRINIHEISDISFNVAGIFYGVLNDRTILSDVGKGIVITNGKIVTSHDHDALIKRSLSILMNNIEKRGIHQGTRGFSFND
jgi:hypothetical protein